MFQRIVRAAVLLAVTAGLFASPAFAQTDQQKLISAAETTLSNFIRDPQMKWLQQNLYRAKAVLIAPEVVKAGFIVGGSGGRSVLLARDPKSGEWRGPSFGNMATASIGFQAGVAVSEAVTLVMTDKGFNSLLATSMKFGGDASVAAGPVGAGASADVVADLVTFSRSKGVFGGLNLDGTVLTSADDWNQAFYGKKVLPPDILVRGDVKNAQADKLRAAVASAATKK